MSRRDAPRLRDAHLDYADAVLAVALATLLRFSVSPLIQGRAPWVFYFPPVAIVAWRRGVGPSLLAIALCAVAGWYFWIPPAFSFAVKSPQDVYVLLMFLASCAVLVAFGASNQRTRDRLNAESAGRERTTRELAESLESFQGLFNHAEGDAVIMMDAGGRVVGWNPGAERIFGYPATEAMGQAGSLVFTPEDRAAGTLERELGAAGGDGVSPDVRWSLRKDGTRFWANGSTIALHHADGEVRGYLKVLRDETARHELEESSRRHAEALERHVAEQTADLRAANAELEGFTYSVSHDMRAPLRAVVANARLLIEDYGEMLPEEGRERLERMAAAGVRMGRLIEDLLTYARLNKQAFDKSPFDLVPLFREVVAEEAGEIETACPPSLPVEAEPGLMRMVLENLVGNAVKYRRPEVPLRLELLETSRAGQRGYAVRDNGIGFEMQYAAKLFEPFERLRRSEAYEGTGIGLANVKRIVERHGGAVWAEGVPGVGATFGFTLP